MRYPHAARLHTGSAARQSCRNAKKNRGIHYHRSSPESPRIEKRNIDVDHPTVPVAALGL